MDSGREIEKGFQDKNPEMGKGKAWSKHRKAAEWPLECGRPQCGTGGELEVVRGGLWFPAFAPEARAGAAQCGESFWFRPFLRQSGGVRDWGGPELVLKVWLPPGGRGNHDLSIFGTLILPSMKGNGKCGNLMSPLFCPLPSDLCHFAGNHLLPFQNGTKVLQK